MCGANILLTSISDPEADGLTLLGGGSRGNGGSTERQTIRSRGERVNALTGVSRARR